MSFGASIVALLKDDDTLYGVVEDRVYEYPETGRKGLTRLLTPDAFDEKSGLLKPIILVLETDDTADGEIVGLSTSFMTPVAVFIYDKGTTDMKYDNIIAAETRIYSLLHLTQVTDAAQILYQKTVKYKRQPDLGDAAYFRAMYVVHAYRTVS